MTCRAVFALSFSLLAACTQQPVAVATHVPAAAPTRATAVEPTPATERVDASEEDAQALLVASAMSYLGKTTARFDGQAMVVIEHDPEELLTEAFADPGFCALVAAADADPHDGLLTTPEAARLESSVLEALDS